MFPDKERFEWFENIARKIVEKCARKASSVPNFSDGPVTIHVPGGDDKYPSFWVRDAVMQCRSGFIDASTMETMLRIILHHQNGSEGREIPDVIDMAKCRVDPWSIADHINLPGLGNEEFQRATPAGAVFYPGCYLPYKGNSGFGLRPADDDIYEAVELARLVVDSLDKESAIKLLRDEINGVTVIDRLGGGMQSMVVDEETGLCLNTPEDWAAANFHDGLRPMGFVALTSCLRFRAAKTMQDFYNLLDDGKRADEYGALAGRLASSLAEHLIMKDGWIMVGSKVDRQPDVWSTSMAVYYGLLAGDAATDACRAMLKAYKEGLDVNYRGYLRHTPMTADVIPGQQVWEHGKEGGWGSPPEYGTYQMGGYWPQPLGYYAYCLARVDMDAARRIASDYIDHTREFEKEGAPFEWISPEIFLPETPGLGRWYGPSAALPLEAFRRLS